MVWYLERVVQINWNDLNYCQIKLVWFDLICQYFLPIQIIWTAVETVLITYYYHYYYSIYDQKSLTYLKPFNQRWDDFFTSLHWIKTKMPHARRNGELVKIVSYFSLTIKRDSSIRDFIQPLWIMNFIIQAVKLKVNYIFL